MAIGTDFTIAANGDIRSDSPAGNHTVLALHRWLQDLADDAAASGDDNLDITYTTPSERSTDNIITLNSPYNIDDDAAKYLYDGSITQAGGDEVYSGLVVVGSVETGTQLILVQDHTVLTDYWGTAMNDDAANNILLRMLVPTRTGGADIDGKRVIVEAREFSDTYAEFSVTMGLGNSVAAIFTADDLNNQTAQGTVNGWSITNTEGFQSYDVTGDGTDEDYYSKWVPGARSINDLYEFTKDIQRRGTAETIHGMNGSLFRGITHEIPYSGEATGPFIEDEEVTWSGGGSGIILALEDLGTTGTIWIQLTGGATPSTETISGTGGATATSGTVVARTVSPTFVGSSTGTSLIGAFGIGVDPNDLSSTDKLFDLTNTLRVPPNNVVFTVYGIEDGDYVLVTNDQASGVDYDQLSLDGVHASSSGTITVTASIPSDTPASGTIRVFNDSGVYMRLPYTSWTGLVFTLTGTTPTGASNLDNVFISYVDAVESGSDNEISFTSVYNAPRTLFIRVREGTSGSPIKTFETTGTLGSTGGSATAIRTSDL